MMVRKQRKIRTSNKTFWYKGNDLPLYAHLDGYSRKNLTFYEIKAPSYPGHRFEHGEWEQLPGYYLWQVIHQLLIVQSNINLNSGLKAKVLIAAPPKIREYTIPLSEAQEHCNVYWNEATSFWKLVERK